ncbi:olfactory receptor 5F1-like [Gastrophryne carolinensis]
MQNSLQNRKSVDTKNSSAWTTFEFSGLTDDEELVPILFVFFLIIYTVTITVNLGMMALVHSSSSLHTPMYYFLSKLSLVDLLYSSVVTPKGLSDLMSPRKSISFIGCALQFYFYAALASTEAVLLSIMSYDRYVAICHPLHYTLIMTKRKCLGLVLYSFSINFTHSVAQTSCVFSLSFCGSNVVEHFFCDVAPLFRLSCSDTLRCEVVTSFLVGACGIYTMTTILLSYAFIVSAVLRMTSGTGRQKAFSTCSSHIICVSTFITSVFCVYLRPQSNVFEIQDKVASVFYSVVTPALNPIIYSLRNQEVKRTLMHALKKFCR